MRRKRTVVTARPKSEPYAGPRRKTALLRGASTRPARRPAPPALPEMPGVAPARSPAWSADGRAAEVDLTVDLAPRRPGGLRLRNPVLVASGTFG